MTAACGEAAQTWLPSTDFSLIKPLRRLSLSSPCLSFFHAAAGYIATSMIWGESGRCREKGREGGAPLPRWLTKGHRRAAPHRTTDLPMCTAWLRGLCRMSQWGGKTRSQHLEDLTGNRYTAWVMVTTQKCWVEVRADREPGGKLKLEPLPEHLEYTNIRRGEVRTMGKAFVLQKT